MANRVCVACYQAVGSEEVRFRGGHFLALWLQFVFYQRTTASYGGARWGGSVIPSHSLVIVQLSRVTAVTSFHRHRQITVQTIFTH